MSTTLVIRDVTPAGGTENALSLEFLTETITVRELIRSRVYQEVQDYNVQQRIHQPFRGLVQPEDRDQTMNASAPLAKHRPIDWKKQFERATEAFEAGKILILIDDRQADSLDEPFTIMADTSITFLRLTLLAGG